MQIIFYPGKPDQEPHTGLSRVVYQELRKKSEKQWEKMDLWLAEIKRPGTDASTLREIIKAESLIGENKTIKPLGNGLYEYRGKQSKRGTIRLYFCFDETTVYILDAEFKTDDQHEIERARKRKKEMGV